MGAKAPAERIKDLSGSARRCDVCGDWRRRCDLRKRGMRGGKNADARDAVAGAGAVPMLMATMKALRCEVMRCGAVRRIALHMGCDAGRYDTARCVGRRYWCWSCLRPLLLKCGDMVPRWWPMLIPASALVAWGQT